MSQLQKITDEQMDAVGVVSAPDVLTGTPSENKNVFDKMVRQLIAPAYNRAVDAIDAINQTETGIQAAEAVRVAAENGRVQAESSRTAAETQRSQAEQARVQAETLREDQETGYVAQAKDGALSAKSWAVGGTGTRVGEDTNNAEYWAKQAETAAGGGVMSFNGRSGAVIPKAGDYDAEKVGAADKTLGNLSDPQQALASLGGRPGRNFADNSRFAKGFVINQRGQTTYTISSGVLPCIDRWKLWGNMTLDDDGIAITKTSQNPEFFVQQIPDEYLSALLGGVVTISAVYQDNGTRKIVSSTTYVPAQGLIDTAELVIGDVSLDLIKDSDNNPARLRFFSLNETTTVKLEAVELVRGDHQTVVYTDSTGALQFLDTPDYGEELLKCQRYLYKVPLNRNLFGSTSGAGDSVILTIDLPVEMRTVPVITDFKNCYLHHIGGQYGPFTPSVRDIAKVGNQVIFQFDNPDKTNIKGGTPLVAFTTSDWFISAEL